MKLIKSYLTQRIMCVRYKGEVSSFKSCPGGGPQGGLLTGVLFCLQVNKAGRPCPLPNSPVIWQETANIPALNNPQPPSSGQDTVQLPASSTSQSLLNAKNPVSEDFQCEPSRQDDSLSPASPVSKPPSIGHELVHGPAPSTRGPQDK